VPKGKESKLKEEAPYKVFLSFQTLSFSDDIAIEISGSVFSIAKQMPIHPKNFFYYIQ
jgi:hypothetical protein